jgi:RimJ/RimL family protein N-acetyltransferase
MVIETPRLILRCLDLDDAPFFLRLVNDPSFIENIADKGVRTLDDARENLRIGPIASYARHGHGLWMVELKDTGTPIGICGLIKRDVLDDVDVGYALLPEFCGQGYAAEAAAAALAHARDTLGLRRVVAIVNEENGRSLRLLGKLGFRYERMVRLSPDDREIQLLACET